MQRHLQPDELETIKTMYLRGEQPEKIAAQHGVHKNTVYDALGRLGVPLRKKRRDYLSDSEKMQISQMYTSGKSFQQIAQQLKLSWRTVNKYAKKVGVQARPAGFQTGEGHHAWKGGRIVTEGGYVLVQLAPDHPFYEMAQIKTGGPNRYCLEHRLVMAQKLGRPLRDDETVHHKDGDKQNNGSKNLQLRQGKHGKGACFRCSDCGSYNVEAAELN